MTAILIVDDEESIRTIVSAYLKAAGYSVYAAVDGPQALSMFRRYSPDLIVLDVMLPGKDGIEVMQEIRRESDVYILLLTAKSEDIDRIVGLTVGADDYVTKPFNPQELVARVKAILRRGRSPAGADENMLRFAHIRIDGLRHQVWRDDMEIDLTALEFKILKTLAAHRGVVLSREQLLEHVWGYDFYGDERVVDVHIGHLRQKLEENPSEPRFIITVRGVGYKFEDDIP